MVVRVGTFQRETQISRPGLDGLQRNSLSNHVKLIVCNRRTPKCDHVIR